MKKFKKWQIITATGAAIAVVGMGSWLALENQVVALKKWSI